MSASVVRCPWARWPGVVLVVLVLALPHLGHAESLAFWKGGSGSWGTASQWDCLDEDGTSGFYACVPDGDFVAVAQTGAVTVDQNQSVVHVSFGTADLRILNATLSTQHGVSVQGTLDVTNGSIQGDVGAFVLSVTDSTLNASTAINASNVSATRSALSTLIMGGRLTMDDSTVGDAGAQSRLVITEASSIDQSTLTARVSVHQNASLAIDRESDLTLPTEGLSITQGALTLRGGSTATLTEGSVVLGVPGVDWAASLLVEGDGTALRVLDGHLNLANHDSHATVRDLATLEVMGPGTISGDVYIGHGEQDGSALLVDGGGKVSAANFLLDGPGTSAPRLSVSDAGSQVTATEVVHLESARAEVRNQAELTARTVEVDGHQAAPGSLVLESGGTLTLTSSSELSDFLAIGNEGVGSFSISDGGNGSSSVRLILGVDPGAHGTMTMTGADSTWENVAGIFVGLEGTGELRVETLSELKSYGGAANGPSGVIATEAGSSGSVTVSEGVWEQGSHFEVGRNGSATLVLEQRGRVRNTDATLAVEETSSAEATVRGSGTHWQNDGTLTVGERGRATLNIVDEGLVTSQQGVIGGDFASASSSDAAAVTVDGFGSHWEVTGTFAVGGRSDGALTVLNGGRMTSASARIGDRAPANGTATVVGSGSEWRNSGALIVGGSGTGQLSVLELGKVSAQSVVIGDDFGPASQIAVGNGGELESSGMLAVAERAGGELRVSGGSRVRSGGGRIGGSAAAGHASFQDESIWQSTGAIVVGTNSEAGELLIQSGSRLVAPEVIVNPFGTLNGNNGFISALVTNNGGVVTPGDGYGLMTLEGDYLQNAGTLLFELGGAGVGQYDQLDVSGRVDLNGGTIQIKFGNGYQPSAGHSFDILTTGLGLFGSVGVSVLGLGPGLGFAETFTASGFGLAFTSAPVPEPATLALLGVGLVLVGARLSTRARPRVSRERPAPPGR